MARQGPGALRTAITHAIRSAFTENLPYKGVALFLSIVLWLMVERQTPRAARELAVSLVFDLDSTLVRTSELPQIHALVTGTDEDFLKLSTQRPEIRRGFTAGAPDSVIIRLRPRDIELPAGLQRTRVRDVQPDSFVVRFDSLGQKSVSVRSALRIVAGEGINIAGAPRFEPDSVRVVGRRQALIGLLSVPTVDRDLVVTDTGWVEVELAPLGGNLQIIPDRVRVFVPVVKQYWQWP